MIFISIMILIVAIALHSISPVILSRISAIVFIYAGVLAFNTFDIQAIGSGIGIYSGLFHVSAVSQLFDIILFLIAALILISSPYINLDRIITNKNSGQYSLIVLFSTLGASLLISSFDLISLYLCIELQSFGVYILSSSFSLLIKITILFTLLLLTIYLLHMENKLMLATNEGSEITVMQAARGHTIINILIIYFPALGTHYSVLNSLTGGELSNKDKRELEYLIEDQESFKEKINKLEEISAVDKAKNSTDVKLSAEDVKLVSNKASVQSEILYSPLSSYPLLY